MEHQGAWQQAGVPLRVMAVTQIFPNSVDPTFSIFNGLQFAALGRLCELDVLAVIPWFPGVGLLAPRSSAGRFAAVPQREEVNGIAVRHPRVLYVPKLGRAFSAALYAASLWPWARRQRGRVDVVLGAWAHPDGVAALMLARLLGVPCAVKVHGSDLNVHAESWAVKRILRLALPRVGRLIAVSRPLAERAISLGAQRKRTVIVRNGIDRGLFRPRPRPATRQQLGQDPEGRWLLYVGRLERAKGVLDLLAAFERLAPDHADLKVVIIGGGAELQSCQAFAARFPGRVVVTGIRPLAEVALWVSACDILTLPSWNEGSPNVILEAFASGRRVVATRVGGIPDLVTSDILGDLVPVRDLSALAGALVQAARAPYDSDPIVSAAPGSWAESASQLLETLQAAADEGSR